MPLPPGIRAAKTPDEPGRWRPTSGELESLPLLMRVEVRGGRRACVVQVLLVADARPPCPRPPLPPTQEDSDTCTRIVLAYVGWLNLRGLTMHYWDASGERYRSTRDCACGGCMGCPSELVMWQGSTQLGKAVEDQNCGNWCTRCCQACCLCTMFTKVRGERRAVGVFTRAHARACAHRTAPSATPPPPPAPTHPLPQVLANMGGPQLTPRYRLRVNICCCGRVNNCCGATCCKDDAVYDILDMDGNLVATIQKTYGRSAPGAGCCGADACCRSANDFECVSRAGGGAGRGATRPRLAHALWRCCSTPPRA